MNEDRERWRRVTELFHAALERPPAERDAFLDGRLLQRSGAARRGSFASRRPCARGGREAHRRPGGRRRSGFPRGSRGDPGSIAGRSHDRTVPHPSRDRARRHGHRLPRRRHAPRPHRPRSRPFPPSSPKTRTGASGCGAKHAPPPRSRIRRWRPCTPSRKSTGPSSSPANTSKDTAFATRSAEDRSIRTT